MTSDLRAARVPSVGVTGRLVVHEPKGVFAGCGLDVKTSAADLAFFTQNPVVIPMARRFTAFLVPWVLAKLVQDVGFPRPFVTRVRPDGEIVRRRPKMLAAFAE